MGRTLLPSSLACLLILLISFGTGPSHASDKSERVATPRSPPKTPVPPKPRTDCDHYVADILFILDSSISVADSDMTKLFRFVATVVEGLNFGPYTTHVAVTLFASTVREEFHLNRYYDKSTLIAAILGISRLSGFTKTVDALISARTISFQPRHGDRENVPNIIILITDGTSSNRGATLHQAQQLHKMGVVIFAIGVGGNVDSNELSNIATAPNDWHVFNLDTYAELGTITNELITKVCKDCNSTAADILFVLDSSGSVSTPNFLRLLKFVSGLVGGFNIGNNTVRVAVTIFASKTIEKIHLNDYYDKASLLKAISHISRISGGTNTADSLLRARTISLRPEHGERPNVPNIVIVITDGKSADPRRTAQQAELLRNTGVVIISIGIGNNLNTNELKAIATGPGVSHVFKVENFKGLDSIKKELATITCAAKKYTFPPHSVTTSAPPTNCNSTAADILFVLDSSGSVSTPNFLRLLKFVSGLVGGFNIGNNTVRVAVTIFASKTFEKIHLNDYYDKASLLKAISHISRISGVTNTADSLLRARTISLRPEHGERPNAPNIVIVITDGKSGDPRRTAQQAELLRNTGVVIISIGVGTNVNTNELKAIATGPGVSHVFKVENFKGLDSIKKELATITCAAKKYTFPPLSVTTSAPPTKRPETKRPSTDCNSTAADILFVLDSSGSVSSQNFLRLLRFVSGLVGGFNIGNNTVRVAVTIFASKTIEKIHLNDYYDKASLLKAISHIRRILGGTNTADSLLRARTISLRPEHGERPNAPNIVIVITDGKSADPRRTAQQAELLRNTGVVIISIGVGTNVNTNELKAIATRPGVSHVFKVENFKGLDSITKELATITCAAKKYTFPPLSVTTSAPPTTTCNKTIADIIFALDTSASVSPTEFKMMLIFVQQMIQTFDIGKDNVRVGVVTFSGKTVLQFHLNRYFDMNTLLHAVLSVKYLRGSTNTADALRYIRTTSFLKQNGNRDNVPNIVIVITDGRSNVPVSTVAEAGRLKRIATIFSIGVGMHVGYPELNAIATDVKHIFTVDNFDALSEIKNSLAIKTCEAGKEKKDPTKCADKADIVFILDSSGSIGKGNFQKILRSVQSISRHFYVNPAEVQIGVDTFDSTSRSEFNMSEYKDSKTLLDAISKIPGGSGQTHMGKALKRLREQSMSAAAGARPNVTHIGILITNGHPNGPLDVVAEATKVKKAGIKLFALGIGPGVSYTLDAIVNQPASKFLFLAENFDSLGPIEPFLSQEACKAAPVKEEIVCSSTADVVFVIDSSESSGKRNFATMLSFVSSLVSKFNIGPQATQVGMLRYNSRNYLEFNLNKYRNKTELQEGINNVRYTKGNSDTGDAISFMHYHMFARASGYRKGVPKVAIVLTDDTSKNANKTRYEANAAQHDNIIMFAIGIGSKVNNIELETIASQPLEMHMFSVKDFLTLESIVNSLANKTCKVIPKDSRPLTCRDKIARCHEFKPEVCTGYPRWSRDFCPNYCAMCFTPSTCTDVAPTCHMLEHKHCAEFPAWSRENCAKSCGFCESKGNKTEIGDEVYSCFYKGKRYHTGESWKDGCEYECSCLDSQRGMFSCWNRCPVYYNLPVVCKLVSIEGRCCKEPVCNFNGKIVHTTRHKKGKRFGVDVCIQDGHAFYEGQSWSVGCVEDCVCRNAKSGLYSCTYRCPHYDYLPSNCHLVRKAGQCCKEVKCDFNMDFGRFKGHGELVKRANPVTSLPCVDKRPCEELANTICTAKDLEFWVIENCPRFCNKCPTVPSEGACLVDGKVYKVGESWKPSCSLTCVCEDGQHGIARCVDKCAMLPNLPRSCKKVKVRGECCERISCDTDTLIDSQKLNNTIGGISAGNQSLSILPRGCMYKGSYYEHNQTWTNGCEWVCRCDNGYKGLYSCSRRCPTFKNLPSSCHLEEFPGEPCCQIPVCNTNTSVVLVPSRGKGIISNGGMVDPVKAGCIYGNTTYLEGQGWIDECKYRCACVDGKRGTYLCKERCEKLGHIPDGCHVENDPDDDCCEMVVCDGVNPRPHMQTTPAAVGKCYYKGQTYGQGESWDDECSLKCICEDAQVGYFRCIDRCLSFSNVPTDCIPKPDPKDPKCCQVFECGKSPLRGFIGIKSGFGKALQTETKYRDKCVYKQKFYQQGDTWKDGCEEVCECVDAKQGHYRCHTRCERYYSLPATCQLTSDVNNCCPTLKCSKPQEECKDGNEMCGQLGKAVCSGVYEDFAKSFCHKTCGLCTPIHIATGIKTTTPGLPADCKDLDEGCADFEMDVCGEAMFSFAVVNCRRFCKYCDKRISSSN